MFKKIILFFIGFVLLPCQASYAQVIFNEIAWKGMSTGATHEWLELLNTGADAEDISGWTIKDGIDQLNIVIPTDTSIPAGGFYVIKRTTSTVTPFNIAVSFNGGLADTGEKLVLSDESGIEVEAIDFSSGWPNTAMTSEHTMQRSGSSWITALPTPGAANSSTPVDDGGAGDDSDGSGSGDSGGETSSQSSSSSSSTSKPADPKAPKLKILAPKIAFVGMPFQLKGEAIGGEGGKYFWNFGDGNSKATKELKNFTYTYFYEGEYIITLEYYSKNLSQNSNPTVQFTIKVVPISVSISKVGSEENFFIELSNNTSYGADISGWRLTSDDKVFVFPSNSNILPKKKIILSPQTTKFDFSNKKSLELIDHAGELVFAYSNSSAESAGSTSKTVATSPPKTKKLSVALVPEKTTTAEALMPDPDLTASALSSTSSSVAEESEGSQYIFLIILIVFIGASAGAVYFIRLKKAGSSPGDDFSILDE